MIKSELKGINPEIKTVFLQAAGTLNEPVLSVQSLGRSFEPLHTRSGWLMWRLIGGAETVIGSMMGRGRGERGGGG